MKAPNCCKKPMKLICVNKSDRFKQIENPNNYYFQCTKCGSIKTKQE